MNNPDFGRLNERTLHAMLKLQIEPNPDCHEVPCGRFLVDVKRGDEVFEIQTRAFEKLRPKLDALLPDHIVTVVYPIDRCKWLIWMDAKTGELSQKRKSPKVGTEHDVFLELYKIRAYLTHPNFRLHLVFVDVEEYRVKNGWSRDGKKGSTRKERIPVEMVRTVVCECLADYAQLLPASLSFPFTVPQYAKAAKCTPRSASRAVWTLTQIGLLTRVGKQGNAYLYEIKQEP
jgi:hypothetical protein